MVAMASKVASWDAFKASPFFTENVVSAIVSLAQISSLDFTTAADIVADPAASLAVASNSLALKTALVEDDITTLVVASPSMTDIITDDLVATNLVANSGKMGIVAASSVFIDSVSSKSQATQVMANSAGAIQAIASAPGAWATYLAGPFFADNLKNAIVNIIGLNPASFADIHEVIGSAAAVNLIAANAQASQALATSIPAIHTLSTSPNLSTILGSSVAMAYFGNVATLTILLAVPSAIPSVFSSSIAKGVIVASTPLVDIIAGSPTTVAYLMESATVSLPASLRNATTATSQLFDGIPNKVLTLKMRANNIGAINANYNFAGSPAAGTGAGDIIPLKGSAKIDKVLGFTAPHWGVAGIAVTAAVSPEWTWYDMT